MHSHDERDDSFTCVCKQRLPVPFRLMTFGSLAGSVRDTHEHISLLSYSATHYLPQF